VGQEDVGDRIHPEFGQPVEDLAAAEVDDDALPTATDEIDVARVADQEDVVSDLHDA
jgi:hypothetical protein